MLGNLWRSSRSTSVTSTFLPRARSSHPPLHGASIRGLASAKRPTAAEFELLVPAVQVFHARFGHFLVPYSFPIATDDVQWPQETRGVNIGRRLHALLTNPRHRKQFSHVLDRLDVLGFPVSTDYKQLLWEKRTFAALRAFYKIHGHSIVPVGFVVPSESDKFPKESWGLELGKRVAKLREHEDRLTSREREDLARVAFSFDVGDTHWQTKIVPALRTFREIHGHGFVKRDFVVPRSDPAWPEATRGLRLGLAVHNMRCHGAYSEQIQRDKEALKRDGWIHLCGSPDEEWDAVVLPALRQFKTIYGHANVPATFVVPASDPWPRGAWGFCLGQLVHTSHSLDIYREQLVRDKRILEDLGVSYFSSLDDKWDQLILPALMVYATVHGSESQMPQRFIVPRESPWPELAWGLRLGEVVGRIRTRNHFQAQRLRDSETLKSHGLDRVLKAE